MAKSPWKRFAKKSLEERLALIHQLGLLSPKEWEDLAQNQTLPVSTANQMSENVLGTLALPFAILPELLVDGRTYTVPMAIEEPSVVAAATYAASLFNRSGGCHTNIHNRLMLGHITLTDVKEPQTVVAILEDHQEELLTLANAAYPSIVKRGGGARAITVKSLGEGFVSLYLYVDTQEAMGANMLNTMLEALTPQVESLTGYKSLMAILSNYALESLVTATIELDWRFLSRNTQEAEAMANRICQASQLAQIDPYRAVTHNKGIFNGLDALLLATGNDWRAIEAGAHAYASQSGSYRGLTQWRNHKTKQKLIGHITLPLPLATKGGSIGLNPTVTAAHTLLGQPTAKELMAVAASLCLAQNFAAMKALVTDGIQKGHMNLQLRSLALLAGAKEHEVDDLVSSLKAHQPANLALAQALLKQKRKAHNK
ncbi:hydroxymethylglutaryl-CoA reductase, degradative [Streptococcus sp. DD12]|uniref:hydroxymethylglutaryl-CoA reductase, degradative n=1 Tax=Streptococcus sp. DD12 TaxID=1777880 RepID=UPI0007969B7D|nr:hydroxymethylglutaryl-CoA reductase, degradative [Streptococcus sp. DD12]KXT76685.1 Hydroxymethylglutaryl-CoA reductase [Streptococcus sp. DD12]